MVMRSALSTVCRWTRWPIALLGIVSCFLPCPAQAAEISIPLKSAVLKPGRVLKLRAQGPFLWPGADPATHGASLTVLGSTGSFSHTFPAGAAGWRGPLKYKDDTCKLSGKLGAGNMVTKLSVICRATGSLSLPESGLAITLDINDANGPSNTYCAACRGPLKGNPDRVFKALECAQPACVGAQGGTVSSADEKLTVHIPAGALSTAIPITIEETTEVPAGNIGKAYEIKPSGTVFENYVTLEFAYDPALVPGDDHDAVAVATVENDDWVAVDLNAVETISHRVSGLVLHFSPHGVKPASRKNPTTSTSYCAEGSCTNLACDDAISAAGGGFQEVCTDVTNVCTYSGSNGLTFINAWQDSFESCSGCQFNGCTPCIRDCLAMRPAWEPSILWDNPFGIQSCRITQYGDGDAGLSCILSCRSQGLDKPRDLPTSTCGNAESLPCSVEGTIAAIDSNTPTSIVFQNTSNESASIYFLNYYGQRVFYNQLDSGQSYIQETYLTHPWLVIGASGTCYGVFLPTPSQSHARF